MRNILFLCCLPKVETADTKLLPLAFPPACDYSVLLISRQCSIMSRRAEGQLFIGRLSKNTRQRDLEEIFEPYGRMQRCEIKYESSTQNRSEGAEMAYAFVDYEDRRDAEDAIKYENGREVCSSSIIVEWAKGNPRRPLVSNRPRHFGTGDAAKEKGYDECYRCHRPGHWARDCPDDRYYGYRRPGRSNYYRSPSPRRRRRSRSRSKDRRHRRSRSRSRSRSSRDKRSGSGSRDRRRRSPSTEGRRGRDKRTPENYKRDKSASRSKSRSRSKSKSAVAASRSRSRSPSRSRSRSRSASKVKTNGEQDEVVEKPARSRSPSRSRSRSRDKFSRQSRSRSASQS